MAGRQLLAGKIRQAGRADAAAVAGPVFLSDRDLLSAKRAEQGLPHPAAVKLLQKSPSLKNRKT